MVLLDVLGGEGLLELDDQADVVDLVGGEVPPNEGQFVGQRELPGELKRETQFVVELECAAEVGGHKVEEVHHLVEHADVVVVEREDVVEVHPHLVEPAVLPVYPDGGDGFLALNQQALNGLLRLDCLADLPALGPVDNVEFLVLGDLGQETTEELLNQTDLGGKVLGLELMLSGTDLDPKRQHGGPGDAVGQVGGIRGVGADHLRIDKICVRGELMLRFLSYVTPMGYF
jgi:hypothetical protein